MRKKSLLVLPFLLLSFSPVISADTNYKWETHKPTDYRIVLKDNGRVYLTVSLDFFIQMLQQNHPDMKYGQIRANALRAAKVDMMKEYLRMRDGEKQFTIDSNTFYLITSGIVRGVNPKQRGNQLELFLGHYDMDGKIIRIYWRNE